MRRGAWMALAVPAALLVFAAAAWWRERPGRPPPASAGLDADGDPLPPWAVCRIGTKRFRGAQNALAFVDEGRRLTTCTPDGFVRTIDRATGATVAEFPAQTGWVAPPRPRTFRATIERAFDAPPPRRDAVALAAVSPDGRRVVTVGETGNVFDLAGGARLASWRRPGGDAAAWTPDGTRIVLVGSRLEFEVRGAADGKLVLRAKGDEPDSRGWEGSTSVAVSPDGRFAAGRGYRTRVVDLVSGREVFATKASTHAGGTAFSPDGAFLAHAGDDGKSLVVRETKTWTVLREFPVPADFVAFSPDGGRVAAGGASISVLDVATGRVVSTVGPAAAWFERAAFSPDGRSLAALRAGTIRVFDAETGREETPTAPLAGRVGGLLWSPDGARLAVGDETGVVVCDAATGRVGPTCVLSTPRFWLESFSPDGRRLRAALRPGPPADGELVDFDPSSGAEIGRGPRREGEYGRLDAFGPRPLAFLGAPPRLIDVADGRVVREFPTAGGESAQIRFDGDARLVATAQEVPARSYLVRDLDTGGTVATIAQPQRLESAWSWRLDGGRLVVSDDGAVAVFDARSGRLEALVEFKRRLDFAILSPDGRLVAAFDQEGAVRLLALPGGEELATLSGPRGRPLGAAFSPDGRRLATASEDGTVLVWDVVAAAKR